MEDLKKGPFRLSGTHLYFRDDSGKEKLCYSFAFVGLSLAEIVGFRDLKETRYFVITDSDYEQETFANVYCFDDQGIFKWQIEPLKQAIPPSNWPKGAGTVGTSWVSLFWDKGYLCGYLGWGDIFEIDPETGKVGKFLYKTK